MLYFYFFQVEVHSRLEARVCTRHWMERRGVVASWLAVQCTVVLMVLGQSCLKVG